MDVEIEEYDVEIIMGDQYKNLYILLENSWCVTCNKMATIINYRSFLNNLNDVILKGFCFECGGKVNRYIETGENAHSAAIAKHIKNVLAVSKGKKR